jgi:P-aminobenzoate N-oxygenase AurF
MAGTAQNRESAGAGPGWSLVPAPGSDSGRRPGLDQTLRVRSLYERATQAQWTAGTDIDWSIEVPFGATLPDEFGFETAAFDSSPLSRRGRPMWDTFRWEWQAWMVSQFLHGERAALVVAARLIEAVPDENARLCAAAQAGDEARHVEVFSRYLDEHVSCGYPISPALGSLLADLLNRQAWDLTALGMQIIVEALAMAAFRMADQTFHDDLIKTITRLVARDEARHVSFGVLSLEGIYREMTAAERAEREDLVLEAAHLTRRRFLLEDLWERLEVPRADGVAFAAANPTMTTYRRTIFAKVVTALRGVGLMTPTVRAGLADLGLIAG